MGTNAALATSTILAEAPEYDAATRGAHARTRQNIPDIRVIACPGGASRHLPRHARAATAALPRTSTGGSGGQPDSLRRVDGRGSADEGHHPTRLHRADGLGGRLQGAAFGLTAREQAFAAGAGVLFTVAALAAILL